jgi:hypothetical protein
MSSESLCQVARSWVDVGSFHMRLVVRFMNFIASFRNIFIQPRVSLVRTRQVIHRHRVSALNSFVLDNAGKNIVSRVP